MKNDDQGPDSGQAGVGARVKNRIGTRPSRGGMNVSKSRPGLLACCVLAVRTAQVALARPKRFGMTCESSSEIECFWYEIADCVLRRFR